MSAAGPVDGVERALQSIDRKLTVLLWVEAAIAAILVVCAAIAALAAAVVFGLRLRRAASRGGAF